ncbi:acyl-CoA-binding domain-containing protein 4 isoform X8 [Kogia breviceps]|uniref:acyl-CoA-binding domain-containing protein 4 isoform X8 n=1 Tax=Kogia breviceps TaxID=27615 RepID=UPI0034D1B6F1
MGTENESPEPDCQKQFQAAVSVIQNLPKNGSYRPSYKEMLRFYSYYKQATMGPCLVPQPGFWDPIGRYKWDAWNSLGKMSREQAMSAYITEMKLVAQRVIDTVPLGEVAEDMFGYFEPLYQVIPDMPRPPETFLKRVTGWKEQVLNGDAEPAPEPPCLPKEPAPPSPAGLCRAEGRPGRRAQHQKQHQVSCREREIGRHPAGAPGIGHMAGGDSSGTAGEHAGRPGETAEPGEHACPPQAEASVQCRALAPQALCSHAALLPPVALHRPVALPTVSDPEEVTLNGGVSAANGGGSEPS